MFREIQARDDHASEPLLLRRWSAASLSRAGEDFSSAGTKIGCCADGHSPCMGRAAKFPLSRHHNWNQCHRAQPVHGQSSNFCRLGRELQCQMSEVLTQTLQTIAWQHRAFILQTAKATPHWPFIPLWQALLKASRGTQGWRGRPGNPQ